MTAVKAITEKSYRLFVIYLTAGLGVITSVLQWFVPAIIHPLWFIELLLIALIEWGLMAWLLHYKNSDIKAILRHYQTTKMAKLLLFLIILATYVFAIKEHAFEFLICFLIYYVFFTVLETICLQKLVKQENQKQQPIKENEDIH
ncbi:hypothetical protein FACS1894201_06030 [Bacteroidia bacterium]|nr:hypothetical protein FACS1894201_06030 [Bacteroidia bacterium]